MTFDFVKHVGRIDIGFALKVCDLSWQDIEYAYKNGLIGWRGPIDYAKQLKYDDRFEVFEISTMEKNSHSDLSEKISALASGPQNYSPDKWIRVSLHWILQRPYAWDQPFPVIVDTLIADFGYPDSIQDLVTFSTSKDHSFTAQLVEDLKQRLKSLGEG